MERHPRTARSNPGQNLSLTSLSFMGLHNLTNKRSENKGNSNVAGRAQFRKTVARIRLNQRQGIKAQRTKNKSSVRFFEYPLPLVSGFGAP
jgi:hypothetical protein